MLGQHTNIATGLETFWFNIQIKPSSARSARGSADDSVRFWDGTRREPLEVQLKRLASFFDVEESITNEIAAASQTPAEFLDRFMTQYARQNGKRRWAEKTPPNVLYMRDIFEYWKNARFIYCIRDPRDVYSSLKRVHNYEGVDEFVKLWIHFTDSYHREADGNARIKNNVIEIRYEDLIINPRNTMEKILSFVGEPWEEAVATFNGRPSDLSKVRQYAGKNSTTLERLSRPMEKTRVGAWKEEVGEEKLVEDLERSISSSGYAERWAWYRHVAAS